MLKKVTLLLTVVLFTAGITSAQWNYAGPFPDDTWKAQNHAMAVDPDGKIWAGQYANVDYTTPGGFKLPKKVYLTFVFNPDGSQASFSPIFEVLGDTMYNMTQRGMRTHTSGNILLATGVPALYLIDYKTGKGLKKAALTGSPTAPAVAADGTIFIGPVVPGAYPVSMYDANLTPLGSAVEKAPGYSRSFEVSKDGNTIYWAGYDKGKIFVYNRASEFDTYVLKDSLFAGMKCESFTWHPKTGHLWMSAGSQNDQPTPPFTKGTWYAYDFAQQKFVDSLKWQWTDPTSEATKAERPRALAFSNDGKIAYAGSFGVGTVPMIQKFITGGSDIKTLDEIPTGYELSQNYPNPFNPTTNIKFSIPEEGMVSLRVYDALGQLVETLIDTYKGTGTYEVSFDASKLSSGIYIYKLTTGKMTMSKKMLLVK